MIGWLYRIPYSRCSKDIHYQNQKVIFVVKWLVWTQSRSHDSKQMWKRSHSHIEVHILKSKIHILSLEDTQYLSRRWFWMGVVSFAFQMSNTILTTHSEAILSSSGNEWNFGRNDYCSNHDSGPTSDGGGLNSFWYMNLIYWRWWLFLIFFEDLELINDSIIHPFVDLQFYTMCLFCFHWLPITISFFDSFVFSFENRRIMKLLHTIDFSTAIFKILPSSRFTVEARFHAKVLWILMMFFSIWYSIIWSFHLCEWIQCFRIQCQAIKAR